MSRRYFTPGALVGHVVVLAAVLVCLRLGWWQWEVSQLPRGTMQNLGYAVLWPVFAGSFIFMWLRFLQLESMRADDEAARDGDPAAAENDAADADAATASSGPLPARASRPDRSYTVGVGYITSDYHTSDSADDIDDELAAYNRALAALADEDEGRAR